MSETLQAILLVFSVIGGITSLILGFIKHRKIFLVVASCFLMLVGFVVTIGYFLEAPKAYTFPAGKTPMALATGFCFLIAGFIDLMFAVQMDFKTKK